MDSFTLKTGGAKDHCRRRVGLRFLSFFLPGADGSQGLKAYPIRLALEDWSQKIKGPPGNGLVDLKKIRRHRISITPGPF